jgi:hypothetical protein
MDNTPVASDSKEKRGFSGLQVTGIVLAVIAVTVLVTFFVLRSWLFPPPFEPVTLSGLEQQQLDRKLGILSNVVHYASDKTEQGTEPSPPSFDTAQQENTLPDKQSVKETVEPAEHHSPERQEKLEPEAYNEDAGAREIQLNEREINAILAKNTDLADKVAIDLAKDLVSAKILIPLDPDFPVLGGKTLKVKAGLELIYGEEGPVVKIRGISLMGVPLPNAWMGGLKNIDLVKEYGQEDGFWHTLIQGLDSLTIEEGHLRIVLKE